MPDENSPPPADPNAPSPAAPPAPASPPPPSGTPYVPPSEAQSAPAVDSDADALRRARRSARERRAENVAKASTAGVTFSKYRIHIAIALVGLAIMGGIHAYQVYTGGERDCPGPGGHWHSTVTVYVNGQAVNYANPAFTYESSPGRRMPLSSHMHQDAPGIWHWEPPGGQCQPFEESMHLLDTDIHPGALTFTGTAHPASLRNPPQPFADNETHNLRWFQSLDGGPWTEQAIGDLLGRQMRDQERTLIVYGPRGADVTAWQTSMMSLPVMPAAEPHSYPVVPMIGVGVMTLIAVWVWNSLSRRT